MSIYKYMNYCDCVIVISFSCCPTSLLGFHSRSDGNESACDAGALGSIPGSGRSPGEGNGNPLQYSCLENPMDRGAWRATVHGVARVGHDLATKPPPYIYTHGYIYMKTQANKRLFKASKCQ